jgi:photosystem II stability/assembly factor-like uncharacterized protein
MTNQLLLGTRKGLLQLELQDGQWKFVRESFKGAAVSFATTDPRHGTLWACLDHGHWGPKLHRSQDNGESWQEIPLPQYPESTGKSLSYLWYLVPGGADRPNQLYLGTEPGGLFRSDDGGDTFQFVETLWDRPEREEWWFGGGRDHPGLCSIVVDPRDSRHVIVGISVGGVYETKDDGETWEPRNKGLSVNYMPDPHPEFGHDPHFILASPSNPDVLWQQNHCGIFRSTDGAGTWNTISEPDAPAYFGFALALDETNENTAWVVPAIDAEFRMAVGRSLCVCRTEDGGKTWTALRDGLPQEVAYDVVFRHALALSGNRLAFGTTTGNVYVSDDKGDHWASIGNNFPPVYSVRFY